MSLARRLTVLFLLLLSPGPVRAESALIGTAASETESDGIASDDTARDETEHDPAAADTAPDDVAVETLALPYGQRLTLPLAGVGSADAADPERVLIEIEQGRLSLTGLKKGQTMLYVSHAGGLRVYRLEITAPVLNSPRRRQLLPELRRDPGQPAGLFGLQMLAPFADSAQLPQLQSHYLLELGAAPGAHLLARLSQQTGFARDYELESSSLTALKATYQDRDRIVDLGDTGLWNLLTPLTPGLMQFRGGQWTESLGASQYQLFAGTSFRPWYLWGGPAAPAETPWLGGGSGQWRLPLPEGGGELNGQALALGQSAGGGEGRVAGGLSWNLNQRLGLNLALGTNFRGLGLLSGAYLQQRWSRFDWLNLSALYRHLDGSYQLPQRSGQDLLGLRFSSGLGPWGLAGSGSLLLEAGAFESGQAVLRLNRRLWNDRLLLYGQAGSLLIGPGASQHELRLGWILRQLLALTGNYSWRLNQSGGFYLQQHQLQLQARLLDLEQGQLWLVNQTLYQPDSLPGLSPRLFESLSLQVYAPLDPALVLRGSLGWLLSQELQAARGRRELGLNTSLSLAWLPAPVHQLVLLLSYQLMPESRTPHLLSLGLGYNWRYGYEAVDPYARVEGLVFLDRDGNGRRDPDEPGAANVGLRLAGLPVRSDGAGRFRLEHLPAGIQRLELDESSLPPGYQAGEFNDELELRPGANPELLLPLRDQITISGLVFASHLLATGLDGIQLLLDDQPIGPTAFGGRFSVITRPGAHTLAIDPTSIPSGYRFEGPLTQRFESAHNLQLDFVLQPEIELNLVLHDQGRPLAAALTLSQPGAEARGGVCDAQGRLRFAGVLPGEAEVRDEAGHVWRLELPDRPGRLRRGLNLAEAGSE